MWQWLQSWVQVDRDMLTLRRLLEAKEQAETLAEAYGITLELARKEHAEQMQQLEAYYDRRLEGQRSQLHAEWATTQRVLMARATRTGDDVAAWSLASGLDACVSAAKSRLCRPLVLSDAAGDTRTAREEYVGQSTGHHHDLAGHASVCPREP